MMTMIWFLRPPLLHFFILSYPSVFPRAPFLCPTLPSECVGFVFSAPGTMQRGEGNDCGIYCAAGERTKELGKSWNSFSL